MTLFVNLFWILNSLFFLLLSPPHLTFAPLGFNYSTELDVYADGYSLRLVDPYNAPVLYFRRPGDDHEGK